MHDTHCRMNLDMHEEDQEKLNSSFNSLREINLLHHYKI